MDTDQGRASLQELQQAYGVLQKVDQDEDGNITRNELRQRQREMALQWVDHCFQNLDDNDDGEISDSEAKRSAFAQRFERLDGKDDDVLTRRELQAAAMPASRESPEGQTETNQNSGRSQTPSREPEPIHTGTGRPLIDEYPGRSMGRQQGSAGVFILPRTRFLFGQLRNRDQRHESRSCDCQSRNSRRLVKDDWFRESLVCILLLNSPQKGL